jgi:hypothetical protein
MQQLIPGLKAMIIITLVIIFLASCNDDEFVFVPETSANLVIVTDNDPGSYIMVRILGEIRSNFPDIQITYLQGKKFDVFEGAFLINTAMQSFPDGTVIAGILEPGANSRRIVFECGSKRVFVPDNTLATLILNDYPETDCYFIENASVLGGGHPEDLSFEDFYAKAICALISGTAVSGFGSICLIPNIFEVQEAVMKGDTISGQVLFTDNFGNCTTNIPDKLISQIPVGTIFLLQSDTVQLNIELGLTYSSVPVGENVCFFNNSNLLDLSVNYGNFSEKYNIAAGSRIKLIKQ